MVRNITALSKLDNLSLSFFFFDHSKGRVGVIHILFGEFLVAARPADHVNEATLVAVAVRNAECVDESVIEWGECFL
jgi:hypothetical protein